LEKIRFKKLRLWVAYPLAILYFVFAVWENIVFLPGLFFVIAGLLIRLWAAGFIKKKQELTTAGPYAYVRNPLYLGNLLIGIGFCLFLKNIFLVFVFGVFFSFFYLGTIREEENLLTGLFGSEYIKYKDSIPALFPLRPPYRLQKKTPYSFNLTYKNGEIIRVLISIVLVLSLFLMQYFYKRNFENKNALLVFCTVFIIFLALTLIAIIDRRNSERKKLTIDK